MSQSKSSLLQHHLLRPLHLMILAVFLFGWIYPSNIGPVAQALQTSTPQESAQALLQTREISQLSEFHPGGFPHYAFSFQGAVLSILVCIVVWGIAGFGVFDSAWPTPRLIYPYLGTKVLLFSFASLSVRECWNVVLSSQRLMIARHRLKSLRRNRKAQKR